MTFRCPLIKWIAAVLQCPSLSLKLTCELLVSPWILRIGLIAHLKNNIKHSNRLNSACLCNWEGVIFSWPFPQPLLLLVFLSLTLNSKCSQSCFRAVDNIHWSFRDIVVVQFCKYMRDLGFDVRRRYSSCHIYFLSSNTGVWAMLILGKFQWFWKVKRANWRKFRQLVLTCPKWDFVWDCIVLRTTVSP